MLVRQIFLCLALLLPSTLSRAADATNAPAPATPPKSPEQIEGSSEWFQKNLQSENLPAILNVASNYFFGNGVPLNAQRAVQLFAALAYQENVEAERFLGFAYFNGNGVPANLQRGLDWFQLAARSGNAKAQVNLGETYLLSASSRADQEKGFAWISKSAAQGYVPAQGDLGRLYRDGIGVVPDPVESLKWIFLAADSGDKKAIVLRDKYLALTDAAQQAEARRRAQAFQPQPAAPVTADDAPAATCSLHDYIQIPVTLLGGPKTLLVDTGSTITWFDTNYIGRLRSFNVVVALSGQQVDLYEAPEIFIGSRRFDPLLAITSDLTKINQVFGSVVDGVLGLNLLKNYVVCFYSDDGIFTLGGDVPERLKKGALVVPLKTVGSLYGFYAFINGQGPYSLAVDTGFNGSIALSSNDWKSVFSQKPDASVSSKSVAFGGVTSDAPSARLQSLAIIGTRTYTNLIADAQADPTMPSTVGLAFLQRYNCAIDFPNRTLYLQPGREVDHPDESDMSGLHLLKTDDQVTVYSVDDNSPAAAAGIKPNDQILYLNGQAAATLSLKSIRDTLKSKPGEEIKIELKRSTTPVTFRLKRLL